VKKINISQVDTLFVNGSYPIEFLIYYNYKINTASIKRCLKELSSAFWPLFGNYASGSIQWSKYIEDKFCSESIHDEDFTFAEGEMKIWEKYRIVNHDNMEGLFYLSVLQFNNGTVIIPKMNHLVADGYSYFYFLSVLAALSKSSNLPSWNINISQFASPELTSTTLRKPKLKSHLITKIVQLKLNKYRSHILSRKLIE
jgi:hypothetical protein